MRWITRAVEHLLALEPDEDGDVLDEPDDYDEDERIEKWEHNVREG